MADVFINIPDSGSPSWKKPVVNPAALPLLGNQNGDTRVDLSTDSVYIWNGTSWILVATPGAAVAIDGLIGDVSASGPGVVSATVNFVGGVSAANVALGANAANAATSSNTPNTIVKRNGSGNFSAGNVTVNALTIAGSISGSVQLTGPSTITTYILSLPSSQGAASSYLQNDGSGNLSWTGGSPPVVTNNIDGGTSASLFTTPQIITGGTA